MTESVEYGPIESPHEEKIVRVTVPEMDAILGRPFRILDDGFVRVVDYLGGDESIVQAARVSYGRGTRRLHEDRGLIRYLMRHQHTTPFEMCEIKLHVRVPMDAWRQWIRHRTANVNEYSTRYSIAIDKSQATSPDAWRRQASGNRQGSEGLIPPEVGARLSERERELQRLARQIYEERIEGGVAREQARKDLPLSTYTEAYWKVDLWNLLRFLGLRMDRHAQQEIREYACAIGHEIVAAWVPVTWQAFLDYTVHAVRFSSLEAEVLKRLLSGDPAGASDLARSYGWLERDEAKGKWKRHRERSEFEVKMRERFGYAVSWSR
ncbi:MAG: FAD-dependent thymidylate synthase [Planctomycetes bacterium]|nr:FAD-dependent thymidylate synthase [Planctomycetota bacterium]